MNPDQQRWQIQDVDGRILVDYVTQQIALEIVQIFQANHNMQVTLHHIEGGK